MSSFRSDYPKTIDRKDNISLWWMNAPLSEICKTYVSLYRSIIWKNKLKYLFKWCHSDLMCKKKIQLSVLTSSCRRLLIRFSGLRDYRNDDSMMILSWISCSNIMVCQRNLGYDIRDFDVNSMNFDGPSTISTFLLWWAPVGNFFYIIRIFDYILFRIVLLFYMTWSLEINVSPAILSYRTFALMSIFIRIRIER